MRANSRKPTAPKIRSPSRESSTIFSPENEGEETKLRVRHLSGISYELLHGACSPRKNCSAESHPQQNRRPDGVYSPMAAEKLVPTSVVTEGQKWDVASRRDVIGRRHINLLDGRFLLAGVGKDAALCTCGLVGSCSPRSSRFAEIGCVIEKLA